MQLVLIALLVLISTAGADENKTLWDLTIEGNRAIPSDEIEDAILLRRSSHILFIEFNHPFDAVALQSDKKRIEHLYQRHGYYRAKVVDAEVMPCSRADRVCVVFHVNEGEPTLIQAITIKVTDAYPAVDPSEVKGAFGMNEGEIFDHDRYLNAKKTVLRFLAEKSYPNPRIEGKAVYDERSNRIAIALEARPGTAARLGFISFRGLDRIRPEDAMSRLPLKSGEWYQPKLFEDAESLLVDLDVFQSIDHELVPRPADPSTVDVIYQVKEKPLKSLQFGAGFRVENSRQEVRGRVQWLNRNFYDHLRQFGVRVEPRFAVLPSIFRPQQSGPMGNVDVTLRQPAFFGATQDLRTVVGFDSELEQGYRWYGPRASGDIERRFGRRLKFAAGYTFRYLRFYDVALNAQISSNAVPIELLFSPHYRLGYLSQRVTWDQRDQLIEPRHGLFAQLATTESLRAIASEFSYFRMQPEARYYIETSRNSTLASRVTYGELFPQNVADSPITERFYGGGSNGHRGFGYHRLSPQALANDGQLVPIGGNVSFLFTAEQRVNLFQIGESWVIGAIFFDAGDVVSVPQQLDLGRLHYAVGPGVRYDTSIGVLRADVGFRVNRLEDRTGDRVNPDPGERYAIHVSLGEAF